MRQDEQTDGAQRWTPNVTLPQKETIPTFISSSTSSGSPPSAVPHLSARRRLAFCLHFQLRRLAFVVGGVNFLHLQPCLVKVAHGVLGLGPTWWLAAGQQRLLENQVENCCCGFSL